jgi:hypothetical protein
MDGKAGVGTGQIRFGIVQDMLQKFGSRKFQRGGHFTQRLAQSRQKMTGDRLRLKA